MDFQPSELVRLKSGGTLMAGEQVGQAPMMAKKELTAELARLLTRLNPFDETEQGRLINWGWLMMDFAMRTHATLDAPSPSPSPSALPLPDFPLG